MRPTTARAALRHACGDLKLPTCAAPPGSGQPSKPLHYERILASSRTSRRAAWRWAVLPRMGDYARRNSSSKRSALLHLPPDLRQQSQIYGNAADQYIAARRPWPSAMSSTVTATFEPAVGDSHQPHRLHRRRLTAPGAAEERPVPCGYRGRRADPCAVRPVFRFCGRRCAGAAAPRGRGSRLWHDRRAHRFGLQRWCAQYAPCPDRRPVRWWTTPQKPAMAGSDPGLSHLAGKQDQITIGVQRIALQVPARCAQDKQPRLFQGSFGWLHGAADGRGAAGVTLIAGVEKDTERPGVEGDKPFAGFRVTMQRA